MIQSSKVAISLPREKLKRLEKMRKELGIQRSKLIDMAVSFWLDSMEKQKLIKQYEDGYRRRPESVDEIKAGEKLSAQAFEEEGWK